MLLDTVYEFLKLINYSCSSYPTRASYSGQVDEFRNTMKNELKTRPSLKAVFEIISNTDANFLILHIDKATKTRGDKQLYLIAHFTKQTLNLNYLLLTLNVKVQILNYPKQKRPFFLKFKFSLNGGNLVSLVLFQPCCTLPTYNGTDVKNFLRLNASLQNRRDFLRISGEQRRKRGERVASASCVRGEER